MNVPRLLLLATLAPAPALAQGLLPPMTGVAPNQPSYVVLTDGTRLEGRVMAVVGAAGDVRKLTLKTEDRTKHKLKPPQIAELGNKPGDLMRMAARANSSDSVAEHNQYDGRGMPDWMTWLAKETMGVGVGGVQMTGGVATSYMVTKDASAPIRVHKRSYDAQYAELFGDCEVVAQEEPKWKQFGRHVRAYEEACGTTAHVP
jgi:hypothetical protein